MTNTVIPGPYLASVYRVSDGVELDRILINVSDEDDMGAFILTDNSRYGVPVYYRFVRGY